MTIFAVTYRYSDDVTATPCAPSTATTCAASPTKVSSSCPGPSAPASPPVRCCYSVPTTEPTSTR